MLVAQKIDMKPAESNMGQHLWEMWVVHRASREEQCRNNLDVQMLQVSVLNSDLLAWQDRKSHFNVHKQRGRRTVGNTKPRCEDPRDSKRWKLRQRVRRKGQLDHKTSRKEAKATREFESESSQCHSEVATRALRESVWENIIGQNVKPVTMAQDMPHKGLLIRWGTFSPRELARFKELLEKPVKLKPGRYGNLGNLDKYGN
ncbi:hypothetical protein J1N35_007323 [Gossypium stocksii]|uniref:Uncharacterized protein n=1 Tax=Gossypium stocksii TaxID=47602 RepID=A0A9D3W875_9ROSI|nr:hypothetical protein J1N35_007323 [Gossypium stocksii]